MNIFETISTMFICPIVESFYMRNNQEIVMETTYLNNTISL